MFSNEVLLKQLYIRTTTHPCVSAIFPLLSHVAILIVHGPSEPHCGSYSNVQNCGHFSSNKQAIDTLSLELYNLQTCMFRRSTPHQCSIHICDCIAFTNMHVEYEG